MITETQIRQIKYGIEQLPDSWFGAVPANSGPSPPVLDLKRFSPHILRLQGIQGAANANVSLRARYDSVTVDENTAAMLNIATVGSPGAWDLPAKDQLRLNYFGAGGVLVPVYSTFYSLWVIKATVAHKILWDIPLTPNEVALAKEFNVRALVAKGLAPLPLRYQTEREYTIVGEETHTRSIAMAIANTPYVIENIPVKAGEILVLTKIAAQTGAAVNVISLTVDRDDDASLVNLFTFPLSLAPGGEIECYIPATREIRLTCQAAVVPITNLFRYTYRRIRLNDIVRARLGLAGADELAGDVWKKVMAGVL